MPHRLRAVAVVAVLLSLTACDASSVFSPGSSAPQQGPAAARVNVPTLTTWPVSAGQIDLSWQDDSRNETGWEIQRSGSGPSGTFAVVGTVGENVTSFSNTGLASLTEYCYRVRSFRRTGAKTTFGGFSTVSCSKTYGAPPAATNLAAMPQEYARIVLTWTDNALTEQSFRVERAALAAGPWEAVASLSFNSTSYLDYYRPAEQPACYRVVAVNAYGESPSSTDCTTPPASPSSLSTRSLDAQSIDVSWSDNSAVEDGYEVQHARDDMVFSTVATLPAGANSYHDAGLATDTRYWYRVRALKDGGFTDFSPTVPGATASSAPPAPINVDAIPSGPGVSVYGYNPSVTVDGVRIERSMTGLGGWVAAGVVTGEWWGFFDADRPLEQQVCYRAIAFNRFGDSPPSNVDCTTPPAAPSNVTIASIDEYYNEIRWSDNSNVEDGYELTFYTYDGYYGEYWYVYITEPNVTSLQVGTWETFYGVRAMKDYGYSDWGSGPSAGLRAASKAASLQRATSEGRVKRVRR